MQHYCMTLFYMLNVQNTSSRSFGWVTIFYAVWSIFGCLGPRGLDVGELSCILQKQTSPKMPMSVQIACLNLYTKILITQEIWFAFIIVRLHDACIMCSRKINETDKSILFDMASKELIVLTRSIRNKNKQKCRKLAWGEFFWHDNCHWKTTM